MFFKLNTTKNKKNKDKRLPMNKNMHYNNDSILQNYSKLSDMKNFKKHIPATPTPPGTPDASKKPEYGFSSLSAFSELQNNPAVEEIKKLISANHSFAAIDIEKLKQEFPIEQYMDQDGKITCPVPKEERMALMNKLK